MHSTRKAGGTPHGWGRRPRKILGTDINPNEPSNEQRGIGRTGEMLESGDAAIGKDPGGQVSVGSVGAPVGSVQEMLVWK